MSTTAFDIDKAFRSLMSGIDLDPADTGGEVRFSGQDPILPSRHRLGAIMAMGMMAPAVATQILYRMAGGPAQDLSVDLRRAVSHINPLALFKPTMGGYPYITTFANPKVNPLGFGIFKTRDGRGYLPTAAYPKEIPKWMKLLQADLDLESVSKAIGRWDAQDLEDEAARRGMIGSLARTPEEWLAHPQGAYLSQCPLIEIIKIGDSDPEIPEMRDPARPLSGVKALSFTHVIAGPVTGRTLAEQGAQVLHMANPEFEYDALTADCQLGFRSTWCDLALPEYRTQAVALLKEADVLIENFRGRKVAKYGLSPEEAAEIRPGIIYTSLRAFGWDGPWSDRGGFDMDANCASGYAVLEGSKSDPKLPPTVILNDYLAGYLTAAGVVAAMILRAKHGGSYHVRVSLTRFSMWYSELGLMDDAFVAAHLGKPDHKPIPPAGLRLDSGFGELLRLEPGITWSRTPARWEVPGHPVVGPRGANTAVWL